MTAEHAAAVPSGGKLTLGLEPGAPIWPDDTVSDSWYLLRSGSKTALVDVCARPTKFATSVAYVVEAVGQSVYGAVPWSCMYSAKLSSRLPATLCCLWMVDAAIEPWQRPRMAAVAIPMIATAMRISRSVSPPSGCP